MNIGFASLVGLEPKPFSQVVSWASANGFDSIEINVGPTFPVIGNAKTPGHLDLESLLYEGTDKVEQTLSRYKITLGAIAPMLNLLTSDLDLRKQRIAQMRMAIGVASNLGCDTVVTYAGSTDGLHFYGMPGVGDDHETNRVESNLALFKEVYAPLADFAEKVNVKIAFETAARGGGEGNLAHNPELWTRLFETVPSPALGLSFDPSHLVWLQIPDPAGLILEFRDRIHHVDGKDCEILDDRLARQGIFGSSWWRYRLPGKGSIDWSEIVRTLNTIGYAGPITIEQEDPECPGYDCLAESGAFLREIIEAEGDQT